MTNHPQCTGSGRPATHQHHATVCPDCRHHVRVTDGVIVKHWWSNRSHKRHIGIKHA